MGRRIQTRAAILRKFPWCIASRFHCAAPNGLSDTALRCEDRAIFSNFEWDSVRAEASKALVMMGWESLKAYADELLRECREAG